MSLMRSVLQTAKKILNIVSKVFLVIAVFVVVINLFSAFTSKDKIKIDPQETLKRQREQIYTVLNDPQYQENSEIKATIGIYRSFLCVTLGEACTDNPADGDENFNHSLIGYVTKLIVLPYTNPPASGVYYVYDSLNKAGFVPKAFAAKGVGFSAIEVFGEIWIVFRNFSYLILVLILITIGFMIMFRMKINPQVVVSIENALPKVVISLLLITFSFAIAGFLIDLMYIVTGLSISVLSESSLIDLEHHVVQENVFAGNPWDLFVGVFAGGGFPPFVNVGPDLFGMLPFTLGLFTRFLMGTFVWILAWKLPIIGDIVSGRILEGVAETGGLAKFVLAAVMAIILIPTYALLAPLVLSALVALTALFVFFRIFFILLRAYIEILLLIIFGPLILLLEAIPGRSFFIPWFKGLLSNLIVFPGVAILLMVSYGIAKISTTSSAIWRPPFLHEISAQAFISLVALGLLFLIPNLIRLVKESLGLKALPFAVGPGLFFAGAGAGVAGATGLLGQFGSVSLGLQALGIGKEGGRGLFGLIGRKSTPTKTDQQLERIRET